LIEHRFDVRPLGLHDAKANPFRNALALGEKQGHEDEDED